MKGMPGVNNRGILVGSRWAGRPGIEHTKTASGQLWCQAEEPVAIGKIQSGIAQEMFSGTSRTSLLKESLILEGIHTN
eukprot:1159184-Pelagomonas_calceolata.AAC.6